MAVIKAEIRSGSYFDSAVLMQLQRSLSQLDGVEDAGVVMGTEENKEILAHIELDTPEVKAAKSDDLVIVVRAADDETALGAIGQVDELLTQENAVFLSGQALYPKVLDPQDDSETEFFPAQIAQPYSLAFTLLSGKQKNYIYIPINSTQVTFTHGITISILGCRINDELIKAKAVFLNDGEFSFLVHELDTLTCEEQETQNR